MPTPTRTRRGRSTPSSSSKEMAVPSKYPRDYPKQLADKSTERSASPVHHHHTRPKQHAAGQPIERLTGEGTYWAAAGVIETISELEKYPHDRRATDTIDKLQDRVIDENFRSQMLYANSEHQLGRPGSDPYAGPHKHRVNVNRPRVMAEKLYGKS